MTRESFPGDPSSKVILSATLPAIRSPHAAEVAAMFGIDGVIELSSESDHDDCSGSLSALLPQSGQVTLLTGASGAGKTSLLKRMRKLETRKRHWIRLSNATLPNAPLVDCFGDDARMSDVLGVLSRVGLAEVWTYLRKPSELSEGQRWRLRLAIALHAARTLHQAQKLPTLLIDEFAAVLDRVTASIVARALRRIVSEDARRMCAIVATSHEDLIPALQPDLLVKCDFVSASIELSPEVEPSKAHRSSRRKHAPR
jgi:ABC-type polar amino acid transport system ATPase subunit